MGVWDTGMILTVGYVVGLCQVCLLWALNEYYDDRGCGK